MKRDIGPAWKRPAFAVPLLLAVLAAGIWWQAGSARRHLGHLWHNADMLEAAGKYADADIASAQAVAFARARGLGDAALASALAHSALFEKAAGNYAAAAAAARQAYAITLAPGFPSAGAAGRAAVADALAAQGTALAAMGHNADAESLLRQALPASEAAFGANDPRIADVLDRLAELVGDNGKLDEAEGFARRAMAIRVQTVGENSVAYARSSAGLALILRAQGKLFDAQSLAEAAVAIERTALGPNHPELADGLSDLGLIYRAAGRFTDAEAATREALEIRLANFRGLNPDVATSMNNLALLSEREGDYSSAEKTLREVTALRQQILGPQHPDVGNAYNNLGSLMRTLGRPSEAEQDYRKALDIDMAALGPNNPDVATALANLALALREEGQYAVAEEALRQALAIREAALPPGHPDIAAALTNLGQVFVDEGRLSDAEPAFVRALDIQKKALGIYHPDVAATLNDLAGLYRHEKRFGDSENLYRESLVIEQKVYPPTHPEIANTLGNLADLYSAEGKLPAALRLQEAALGIRVKAFGLNHPKVATGLDNIAVVLWQMGQLPKAEALLRRVLAMRIASFGPNHPDVAGTYNNLAEVLYAEGKYDEALDTIRKAAGIYQARALGGQEANSAAADSERAAAKYSFIEYASLLADRQAMLKGPARDALVAESFAAAQLAQDWSVGAVVAQMAARFASGSGDLAALVREQQDARGQWHRDDAILVKAALEPDHAPSAAHQAELRLEETTLQQKMASLDTDIRQRFPDYAAAVSVQPVSLADEQKLLAPEEAMLSFLITDKETLIWVLRHDRAVLVRSPLGNDLFVTTIRALRQSLNPALATADTVPVYNVNLAYQLYKLIIQPLTPSLGGVKTILEVPNGPLESFPLSALIAKPLAVPAGKAPDYRKADWLVRHYAVAVLPSVGSLRALRLFAHGARAPEPFIGIGDPLLGGPRFKSHAITTEGVDVRLVRNLVPLPETADELRAIGNTLKSDPADLVISGRATRRRVEGLPLNHFRVVAFATHGLVTNELKGLTEPALVLTPDITDVGDDGLLRASQIMQLRFDADWVVLSACNTAAGDTVGAEGLSGLAKAFFYAGTRALLVSHWPVNSQASVHLTTTAVGLMASHPEIGKAEALRQSELALLNNANPYFSHPMMWAPFIVVGEGGAEPKS